jgi:hypothetical protein
LAKHDLEKGYIDWLEKQPTVKYTGYVYELGKEVLNSYKLPLHRKITIDKQFDELVKKAVEDGKVLGNVWCALDTSGSMSWSRFGDVTPYEICISLGVFFSELNTGAFHNNVVMFDNVSRVLKLEGSFTDKINQIKNTKTAWGGTNFQSVIEEMVRVRKENPNIPLEDYPQTLLVVSDMQFNATGTIETNYQHMKNTLYECFPEEFVDSMKFIWWQVTDRAKDVPATLDDNGCYFFSGFDGSIVTLLLGGELAEVEKEAKKQPTMEEMIGVALGQEILSYVSA